MTLPALPAPTTPTPLTPAHFRLSDETWAEIVAAYAAGATAADLARRWRVSPQAVYRRAAQAGVKKHAEGDALARARVEALSAEEEQRLAEAADALFDGAVAAPDDPAELARVAATASARAMHAMRFAEALTLARLAEHYSRIADRTPLYGLDQVFAAISSDVAAERLFRLSPRKKDEPEAKRRYWMWKRDRDRKREADMLAKGHLEYKAARLAEALAAAEAEIANLRTALCRPEPGADRS